MWSELAGVPQALRRNGVPIAFQALAAHCSPTAPTFCRQLWQRGRRLLLLLSKAVAARGQHLQRGCHGSGWPACRGELAPQQRRASDSGSWRPQASCTARCRRCRGARYSDGGGAAAVAGAVLVRVAARVVVLVPGVGGSVVAVVVTARGWGALRAAARHVAVADVARGDGGVMTVQRRRPLPA